MEKNLLKTAILNKLLNAKYFELIQVLVKQGHSKEKAIDMASNITLKTATILEEDFKEGVIDESAF